MANDSYQFSEVAEEMHAGAGEYEARQEMRHADHVWGADGFCVHGCDAHRTDWMKNSVCPQAPMIPREDWAVDGRFESR